MMKTLVHHDTWAGIIGMLYLGLISNVLLALGSAPFLIVLMTTDPALSWPLLALAAPLTAPVLAAVFRAFREHSGRGLGPIRAFCAGLRDTWRRALGVGALASTVLVIVLVDVRFLSDSAVAVYTVPLLAVVAVLTVNTAVISLVALAEVPEARLRDVVKAALYLGLRRWYLSVISLVALIAQAGVFVSAPAIGIGITASAALYLTWTNARYTLRPVLEPAPVPAR